jgi:hypothetical protein
LPRREANPRREVGVAVQGTITRGLAVSHIGELLGDIVPIGFFL